MRTAVLLLLLVTFATGLTVQETVSQDKTNAQAGFMDALKKCKTILTQTSETTTEHWYKEAMILHNHAKASHIRFLNIKDKLQ